MLALRLRPQVLRQSRILHRASYATLRPRNHKQTPHTWRQRGATEHPRLSSKSIQSNTHEPQSSQPTTSSSSEAVSSALHNADPANNNLVSPVHIPEDPDGVLNEKHPARSILENSSIVVTRQLEMMNVMLGFEQANKYVIMDPKGNHIGFMAEKDLGIGSTMKRQFFNTHRSFETHIFDRFGREVLRFHRPFSWISSRIGVYDPLQPGDYASSSSTALSPITPGSLTTDANQDAARVSPLPLSEMRIVGEAQQQWAPLRRKYNLFVHRESADPSAPRLTSGELPLSDSKALEPSTPDAPNSGGEFGQFAYVDERFLSWDFSLLTSENKLLGSVNRNFSGFGREIFTDTGVYALRMDAAGLAQESGHLISNTGQTEPSKSPGMTLDQRAVMLATAVSIDFDYFSRHSGSGGMMGGFWPVWLPGGGEAAGAGAAEAGAAEAGAEAGAVEGTAGRGATGYEVEGIPGREGGAMAGAGSLAGYEAMQRGAYGGEQDGNSQQPSQPQDSWGPDNDPGAPQDLDPDKNPVDWGGGGGDSGGGGGDGGGLGGFDDFF